jgi:hypothetical protein
MYLLAALTALTALATIQVAGAQQGPPQPNFLDRFQSQWAPGAYQARREGQKQKATYDALRQMGATDKEALAGASNPQFLQVLLPVLEARRQQSTR